MTEKSKYDMLFDNLQNDICIRTDGALSYQSTCERSWKESGLDFDLLLDIIEDNIIEYEDGEEDIDWDAVKKDYEINKPLPLLKEMHEKSIT